MAAMARALMPDGEFRFVSDIDDYCAWTLAQSATLTGFRMDRGAGVRLAAAVERLHDDAFRNAKPRREGRDATLSAISRSWAEAALLLCVRPHPRLADIGRFNESKRRQNTTAIGRRPTAGVRPQTCCRRRHRGGVRSRASSESTIGQIHRAEEYLQAARRGRASSPCRA